MGTDKNLTPEQEKSPLEIEVIHSIEITYIKNYQILIIMKDLRI